MIGKQVPRSSIGGVAIAVLSLLALLALCSTLFGEAAAAETRSARPGITLDVSIISLSERDDATEITVTAALREAVTVDTTVTVALGDSPLLTPGIHEGAVRGTDYTATLDRSNNVITIAAGSASGQTAFAIHPAYDAADEGDEAIVLTGASSAGVVAPTEVIIEDGPYLSFPKDIYGHLSYPDQPIAITLDEAIHTTTADGAVTYELTPTESGHDVLSLTFDPVNRRLTGSAPDADAVPDAGIAIRYTITASDSTGRRASALVSVAVVRDECGSTVATWFHDRADPPPGLIADCNVLLATRDTLRGSTGALNWATDIPIARWDGLTEFHGNGQIRKIEVAGRRLNGAIPPVLGHLAAPHSLDLVLGDDHRPSPTERRNRLKGPIPPELGLPPNLIVLALRGSDLSGSIPRELAQNGRLSSLYLSDSPGLSGTIPPQFGDLPLRNLTITGNRGVTGHIPWQLGKNVGSGAHPGLQVLSLFGNGLEGTIPWQLGRFGAIQQLALSDNRLDGAIPWQLGNLGSGEATVPHRVVDLYLNANRLSGTIPPQLGKIANLRVLSLSENLLSGPIPVELGGLTKLQYLYLRDNQLSGSVPGGLGDLGALLELHAHNNRLSGEIPSALGSLASLRVLSLSCNDFSGPVPANIGSIASLTQLLLQGNPRLDRSVAGLPDPAARDGLLVVREGLCPAASGGALTYAIDVTVWRSVQHPERYHVSTRPEGRNWTTHAPTVDLSRLHSAGRFYSSSPVPVEIDLGGDTLTVDVVVWRSVGDPQRYYVSTRPEGQRWTTHNEAIELSGLEFGGRFYQGNPVTVEVSLR